MKCALFSDMQMGASYGGIASALEEQEAILRRILEIAREEGCGAVLFAGDATEHRNPTPDVLMAWERPLVEHRALAPDCPVVAVLGNHDVRGTAPGSGLEVLALAGLLTFFREPGLWCVGGSVWVAALPWAPVSWLAAQANGGDRDDVNALAAEHLLAIARGLFAEIGEASWLEQARPYSALLLTHFAISGTILPNGLPASAEVLREPVLDAHALAGIGFDAVLAGHLQKPGLVVSEPCPVLYAGSPHPMDHGEANFAHGMWLIDVETGAPAVCEFRPLESRRFVTVDIDITDETADDAAPALHADLGMRAEEYPGAIVRVRYQATADQARRIDQAAIRQALLDAGAARVTVEPTILREERQRVAGLTETVSDADALGLWLAAQEVPEGRRARLHDLDREFAGEAT